MMRWFRHEPGELSEREKAKLKIYREPGNMHAHTSEISRTYTPERSAPHTPESSADRQVTQVYASMSSLPVESVWPEAKGNPHTARQQRHDA